MPKLTIGVSGLARSGKDTFTNLLVEELGKRGLRAKRFALADDLKAELRDFIGANYNIDILNCTPEEKELVRDFLVFHGKMKRVRSNGTHWTTKLQEKIAFSRDVDVAVVSDVRYDVYPLDECDWVIRSMGGPLVHIKRWVQQPVTQPEHSTYQERKQGFEKVYLPPPNKDEASNDPRVQAKASYLVDWGTGDIENICRPEVVRFIEWLKEKAYVPL